MKIDFAYVGLNLNIIIQKKWDRKMHVLWIILLKTRGIKYFNVETWMLFAHLTQQNFSLRACTSAFTLNTDTNKIE